MEEFLVGFEENEEPDKGTRIEELMKFLDNDRKAWEMLADAVKVAKPKKPDKEEYLRSIKTEEDRRVCFSCQKVGHISSSCPDKKAGNGKGGKPQNPGKDGGGKKPWKGNVKLHKCGI